MWQRPGGYVQLRAVLVGSLRVSGVWQTQPPPPWVAMAAVDVNIWMEAVGIVGVRISPLDLFDADLVDRLRDQGIWGILEYADDREEGGQEETPTGVSQVCGWDLGGELSVVSSVRRMPCWCIAPRRMGRFAWRLCVFSLMSARCVMLCSLISEALVNTLSSVLPGGLAPRASTGLASLGRN